MSWLFSRALVEEYLVGTSLDGQLSVQLNSTPTPQVFSSPGRTTARFDLSRYGMTCGHSTAEGGEALLTWYRAGFPARPTAAHLEGALWRTISGRKCGASWQMSLPGTYLPRTSKDARSTARRKTSSRWVTQYVASPSRRQTWVLTTYGSDIGYVHTPTCAANYSAKSMQKHPCARAFTQVFGKPDPLNHEYLMGWPIGWTELRPLATDKFHLWRRQHGAS